MLKFLLGSIIIVAACLLYPNPILQRGLYLLTGIFMAIGWVNQTVRKGISVAVDMRHGRGFPGEDLSLILKIKNESVVPVFWCAVRQTFSEGIGAFCEQWILSLRPRSHQEIKMVFRGQRRGIYPIPRTKVVLGDAWGFHESALNYDFSEQIIIYPPVDPVVGLTMDRHLPLGPHTRRFGLHEDPARLRGCRDYQPGDSLRRIHWPNMAKTGQVQVKEWETTLDAEIGVFLNLCEEDYLVAEWFSLSELAIETAASIICHLGNQGERVGFYCNGLTTDGGVGLYQSKPKQGQRQVEKALSYLAAVKTGKGLSQDQLYKEASQMAAGACLLFITPLVTAEMVKKMVLWRQAGYHPVLLLVQESNRDIPQLELAQARLTWFRVGRGRNNNAIQLAKSGC